MSLTPGMRLGPYEVVAAVGEGGMGEVYRARDTRLGRTVAIKLLPADVASAPGARDRLEREAKAISSLNHPGICTLFDVGHQESTDYLVMEYLEGVTLADRLATGALPVDEAKRIAVQIADALAEAHGRGVVHRDLKPANIMLTKAGAGGAGSPHVKLLDFGVARLIEADAGAQPAAWEETRQALTVRGTIVGTLPYMAPEQMAGHPADARSDLFSFGAVLYEMVTGQPAFSGASPSAVMASVVGAQPAPPSSIRPGIPSSVERLIATCLAKDPGDRWQSAHDVALFLANAEDAASPTAGPTIRRRAWIVAAAFLGGAALGLATARALRFGVPAGPPLHVTHLSVPLGADGRLFQPGHPRGGSSVAISRDGQRLVYVSRRNGESVLILRDLDRAEEAVLPGTEGAFSPFFSPDGGWVAYFTETELKKVPLAGGSPVSICSSPPVSRGGTWADDGTIYFAPDFSSGVQRVAAAGGRPQDLTTLDLAAREANHLFPQALPGAGDVLFTVWKGGDFEAASVWAFSARSGKRTLLLERASHARYLPQGFLVFARGGTLLAVRFDPKTLAILGAAVPVVDGVWNDPGTGTAHYAVSDTGTLVYAPGQYTIARQRLAWVDRRGTREYLPFEPGFYSEPKLSPDGQRLAVQILNDLWVYDLKNRTPTRTTFRGVNQAPVWTPDGRHIAFSSSQGVTRPTLYWVDPASGEEPEMLSHGGEVQFPSSWSADGSTLAYAEIKVVDAETSFDIWLLAAGNPRTRQRLIATPFQDDAPMFAPDGRALAWVSNDAGRSQVYVRPYPGSGRILVSPDGGREPVWSRNGTELFYRKDRGVFSVPVSSTKDGIKIGRPALLFEGDFASGSLTPGIPAYDVAPDGRRFLMVTSASDAESPARLDVVLNWVEDLNRRAPRQTPR